MLGNEPLMGMTARQRGWVWGAIFVALGSLLAWYGLGPAPAAVQEQDNAKAPSHALPAGPAPNSAVSHESSADAAGVSGTKGASASPSSPASPAPPLELTPAQALEAVQRLVNQGKIGAARSLAETYLAEHSDGPESAQIKSLTGVHPHPMTAPVRREEP